MSTPRRERLSPLFREQLGELLHKELDLRRDVIVTLTNVQVTEDLQDAIIGVSVLPESATYDILHKLRAHAHHLRSLLLRRLRIRKIPRLKFTKDERASQVQHIEELLDELKANEEHPSS